MGSRRCQPTPRMRRRVWKRMLLPSGRWIATSGGPCRGRSGVIRLSFRRAGCEDGCEQWAWGAEAIRWPVIGLGVVDPMLKAGVVEARFTLSVRQGVCWVAGEGKAPRWCWVNLNDFGPDCRLGAFRLAIGRRPAGGRAGWDGWVAPGCCERLGGLAIEAWSVGRCDREPVASWLRTVPAGGLILGWRRAGLGAS